MKLSIIIPVYNVEKFIERCLLSCMHQDIPYENYEVIVVNDGTKDNSMAIVNRIAKQYSNIIVISQDNCGLSVARNSGMKLAQGEYIWFVDSDDWIEENCLKGICDKLTNNIDILQLQFRYTYDDNKIREKQFIEINELITGQEQASKGGILIPAQFTIYRLNFLKENNLKFYPRIYHEDSEFKPRVLYYAKSMLTYNKIVYNYYQRSSGSITSSFKLKNGLDILIVNNNLIDFVQTICTSRKFKKFVYKNISFNLNVILKGLSQLSIQEKSLLIDELNKNKNQFNKMLCSGRPIYIIESLLFLCSVKLGISVFRLLK